MINKSPDVITQVSHVPGFSFTKHSKRPADLFGKSQTSSFYDGKKDFTMKRLDTGIPDMRKLQSRDSVARSPTSKLSISCIDIEKVIQAKTSILKPKNVSLTNFMKSPARDDSILKTDDRYYNLMLENSKDERVQEI